MKKGSLKASGILRIQELGQLEAVSTSNPGQFTGLILDQLYEHGINVQFAAEVLAPDSRHLLTLCVEAGEVNRVAGLWEAGKDRLHLESYRTRPEVTVLAVYGPHFRERPGAACVAYQALIRAGVPVFAISTSFSAIAFVLDRKDVEKGLDSLLSAFDLGQGAVLTAMEGCSKRV
ncbi:MAG: hypothetical protein KA419_15665 [Acidobacteria bacterium]|nr:hypothetical protein [Acidobacteriota bacterium]